MALKKVIYKFNILLIHVKDLLNVDNLVEVCKKNSSNSL